jgi:hypothetical protein
MTGEHAKYYTQLAAHKMAKSAYDNPKVAFLATATLLASLGGGVAYLTDDVPHSADTVSGAQATAVQQVMEERIDALKERQEELRRFTDQITKADSGSDAALALEQQRAEKVTELENLAKTFVTKAVLSSDLSEQERQKLVSHVDKNIINLGDIGFEALEDQRGDVVAFNYLREARQQIDAENPSFSNDERAQAVAQKNKDAQRDSEKHTIAGIGRGLISTMFLLMGLTMSGCAYSEPRKPVKGHSRNMPH